MTGDIRVDADVMHQHAGKMQQLASDAAEAVSAVRSVNLGGGAFGVLCAWIVPPVGLVSDAVARHISAAQDALDRTADEMRAVVSDFDRYEDAVAQAARSLEGGLQ